MGIPLGISEEFLREGQEIVSVDGEPTTGWSAVNLQLVRRLGETGTVRVGVLEPGSSTESAHGITLKDWLKGEGEPDPIQSLGLRPWRCVRPAHVLRHGPDPGARR